MPDDHGERLARIEERQEAQGEVLLEIRAQTIATNGRVRELEGWRREIGGGKTVAIAIFAVILQLATLAAALIKR